MPSAAEDRDEILQLLYRYNHAVDRGDGQDWANTFTDDAVFDAAGQVIAGREALAAFPTVVPGRRHVVTNPVIDVAGNTAAVRAYCLVFRGMTLAVVGSYEDEVVRTRAGWRFTKRVFKLDPPTDAAG